MARVWQTAGRLEDFPPASLTSRTVSGRTVIVANTPRGLYAIGPTCPHQGASMAGAELCGTMVASEPGRYEYGCHLELVRCPWHRWEFHVEDGRAAFGTSAKRLVTYPLRVEGGEVQVSVPARAR
ncbi:MAG TPA: Rieske (2Fe-2S) protein [Candidatus Dormibacteraeota bacterium]|jgi:nitrite reductase/ring-hydroxylating ferredoxin subunit